MGTKKPAFSGPISVSIDDVLRLWDTDFTIEEIAQDLKVDIEQVIAAAKSRKLKYKKRGTSRDPEITEEEIRQRAAEIRAGWSETERLHRTVTKSRSAGFHKYHYSSDTGIFTHEGYA